MIIGGEQCNAVSWAVIDVCNPETGEWLATLPAGSSRNVDKAVKAAEQAGHNWRYLGFGERAPPY